MKMAPYFDYKTDDVQAHHAHCQKGMGKESVQERYWLEYFTEFRVHVKKRSSSLNIHFSCRFSSLPFFSDQSLILLFIIDAFVFSIGSIRISEWNDNFCLFLFECFFSFRMFFCCRHSLI